MLADCDPLFLTFTLMVCIFREENWFFKTDTVSDLLTNSTNTV